MRTEDFIARCKLLSLLRTLPDRDLTSDERLQLISAFRLFVRQIAHRARTEESKLDLLRLYACLRTAFKYLKVHRSVPTKEQGYFLDAALSFLETERRIVLLQLRYPAATAAEPPKNEVPLAWSSAFTLADLMEVVVALHTLGAVRKPRNLQGSGTGVRALPERLDSQSGSLPLYDDQPQTAPHEVSRYDAGGSRRAESALTKAHPKGAPDERPRTATTGHEAFLWNHVLFWRQISTPYAT